jgi:amino acid permease
MIAFCIIVGDTIPHVFVALFPSLPDTPILWLLTNRKAVIVIFILGVSYPLSLYRDIAKVGKHMYPLLLAGLTLFSLPKQAPSPSSLCS